MTFDEAVERVISSHRDELRYVAREAAQDRLELEETNRQLRERVRELEGLGAAAVTPAPAPVPEESVRPPADIALETALLDWESIIEEPPGNNSHRIDEMIRACHWRYSVISADERSARRNAGDPNYGTYRDNGDFSWCGTAVGSWWKGAGLRPVVLPPYREKYKGRELMVLSSCYRIVREWAQGTARIIQPEQVRRGDIVIVGAKPGYKRSSNSKAAPSWGSHVTMAAGPLVDGSIPTVEGNAKGTGPDGRVYEGVIRRGRVIASGNPKTYRVLHCIRPLQEDLR